MTTYKQVAPNVYIGGQPTVQDFHEAKQRGITTAINLRLHSEPGAAPGVAAASGMREVHIPVDKTALTEAMVDEFDQQMAGVEGPVLIHCATGARAALLLALRRARAHQLGAAETFDHAREMGYDLAAMPTFADFIEATTARWKKQKGA